MIGMTMIILKWSYEHNVIKGRHVVTVSRGQVRSTQSHRNLSHSKTILSVFRNKFNKRGKHLLSYLQERQTENNHVHHIE